MVQKERLLFNSCVFVCCIILISCNNKRNDTSIKLFEKVDTSQVPNRCIFQNDVALKLDNGIYYLNNKTYSGFIKENYENGTLKSTGSYFQGKQHGTTKTYFQNGSLESERNYKDGISYGRHLGFWENGNMKYDFLYLNDKREGLQKQWYESGEPYYALNFTNDKENGMQKAWRENGKLFINYEVKAGIRYGLQKAALCYTLKDKKLKQIKKQ